MIKFYTQKNLFIISLTFNLLVDVNVLLNEINKHKYSLNISKIKDASFGLNQVVLKALIKIAENTVWSIYNGTKLFTEKFTSTFSKVEEHLLNYKLKSESFNKLIVIQQS